MEKTSFQSKLNLLIILLIGFIDYLGIGLVYPIFAVYLFDSSIPVLPADASVEYRGAILGILIALTPISQFFCSSLLGAYSDIKGRRRALLLGVGTGCVGYLFALMGIWLNALPLLFLYRILVGASDATAAVAQATLADISTEENKGRRFSYLNSSLGLGFTVGPFIGGMIADPNVVSWFNYSTPFLFAGSMSLLNFILVFIWFPETRKSVAGAKFDLIEGIHNLGKIFMMKHLKWLFLGGFALSFGLTFFQEFVPVLLREKFNFSLAHIGNYYASTGGCYALGALVATFFMHNFKPEKLIVISLLVTATCMLLFGIVSNPVYLWAIIPLMMGSFAFAYPTTTALISNRTSSESQGEVLGVYQSVGAAAMGLSPLIVGSAVGGYPPIAAWGGAFFLFLASFGFWMGRKHHELDAIL